MINEIHKYTFEYISKSLRSNINGKLTITMAKCNKGNDEPNYNEDLDCIDFQNYKGMFYDDDPGLKYQDEITGAHFEYKDMCRRLEKLKRFMQNDSNTVKENDSASTLSKYVSEIGKHRQKSAIDKVPFKLIPQVQATRNIDNRPAYLYSTTIGDMRRKQSKGESHKPEIPRNHSIGHKKSSEGVHVKENVAHYKGIVKAEKAIGKTT